MTLASFAFARPRNLALLLAIPLSGCTTELQPTGELSEDLLLTDNGLSSYNGLGTSNGDSTNGLNAYNGVATGNGLNTFNGLATSNGLSVTNGLMTFASGRTFVKYLAKCALPAGNTLLKTVTDSTGAKQSYAFPGAIGVAPGWMVGSCDAGCQERVSACLMSLTNSSGRHVGVELVSAAAGLSMIGATGDDVEYPNQEGAVFGNMFVTPPQMFTCTGTQSTKAEQVKRFCIDDTTCPLFTKVGSCATACTQTCVTGPGGAKVCSAKTCKDPSNRVWSNPITVFLHNKMEAGNYDAMSGVVTYGLDPGGSSGIMGIDGGDWVQMNDVQFGTQPGALQSVIATGTIFSAGNSINVHLDSLTGPLLGSVPLQTSTTNVGSAGAIDTTGITGRHPVFFQFEGSTNLGTVSYFELR